MTDQMQEAVEFGRLVREARLRLGMRQADLAIAVTGDASAAPQVVKWEGGRHFPQRQRLRQIIQALPGIDEDAIWELDRRRHRAVQEARARAKAMPRDPDGMGPADQVVASGRAFGQRVAANLEQEPAAPGPPRKKKEGGQHS